MWEQLKEKGILDGRLINHVWSRFESEDRLRLLDIMEQFDLICAAPGNELSRTRTGSPPLHCRQYFVPSLFNNGNVKDECDMTSWSSFTLCVDFHGFFTSMKMR